MEFVGLPALLAQLISIVALLVVVGVIVLIVLFLVRLGRGRPSLSSPLDIAKDRYAKGEITKEEFERLREDLS